MELTLYLAFIAGLVSFISPCVLPLVPAYIGYMGGRMTHSVATGGKKTDDSVGVHRRFVTLIHSLFFVAGFTLVFVGIGLLSTAFVNIIGGQNISTLTDLIGRIGGVVIIFFGLHFMGVLPRWLTSFRSNENLLGNPLVSIAFALLGSALILWGFSGNVLFWDSSLWEFAAWAPLTGLVALGAFITWLFLSGAFTDSVIFWGNTVDGLINALYADTRRDMNTMNNGNRGYGGSALMGVVFSAGWTPCIGPVYGAVLTMAANGGEVTQAGSLLAAYSLGLGVPFMLTALALDSAQTVLRRLQRHMHKVELASGVFLIIIGVLVASGQLQSLSAYLSRGEFATTAINLEEQILGAVTGQEIVVPEDTSELIITDPDTAQTSPTEALGSASPMPGETSENTPVALGSITGLAANGGPSVGISVGNQAPDFETISDTGEPLRLSDHRGEIVLLNFWATWCGPCRIEMPEFEAAYQTHKDAGFTILAVNNGEPVATVQEFREELDLSFALGMDERASIQGQYNIFSYPSTFILGRDGTILARHYGPLTASQINELIENALAA